MVSHGLRTMLYTPDGIDAAAAAAEAGGAEIAVHLKLDTGMHRVGAHPDDAVTLAKQVQAHPSLRLEGVATHLAVADEPDDPATAEQLAVFDDALAELARHGIDVPLVHAANSAGAIAHPPARYSFVRAGISVYGLAPAPGMAADDHRAPSRDGPEGQGQPREDDRGGRPHLLRVASSVRSHARWWRRCPSATPTVCHAVCSAPGARCW